MLCAGDDMVWVNWDSLGEDQTVAEPVTKVGVALLVVLCRSLQLDCICTSYY